MEIEKMAVAAKDASQQLLRLSSEDKNALLLAYADQIDQHREQLQQANEKDLVNNAGLSSALIDRLRLDQTRIDNMIAGIKQIAELTDPVGKNLSTYHHPNGMLINKVQTPIGVIGIIYESRPNVTADVAALCLKSGNAVILRGGKEAIHSNTALIELFEAAVNAYPQAKNAVQLIKETDRATIKTLVQLNGKIDLVIPRGGEGLIQTVTELATVPVIKHYKGLCHIFVDESADLTMAQAICLNAKCQRPGVCNAMETLLIHKNIARDFLPSLLKALQAEHVQCIGDEHCQSICPEIALASEKDWDTEYLDLVLSIKIVDDVKQAVNHINQHGTGHSEAIISQHPDNQKYFQQQVDAAAVYINASTRFTDGLEFGMGAEMGISTDKIHARGPMGLDELCSYKYLIEGEGQIRM